MSTPIQCSLIHTCDEFCTPCIRSTRKRLCFLTTLLPPGQQKGPVLQNPHVVKHPPVPGEIMTTGVIQRDTKWHHNEILVVNIIPLSGEPHRTTTPEYRVTPFSGTPFANNLG